MKKRNELQIIYDLLIAIKGKEGKIRRTQLLSKSNLSSKLLKKYLTDLISKGFILELEADSKRTYKLTKKGANYINQFHLITDFIKSFGLR